MKVVPIGERLPKGGMCDDEKAELFAALDDLKADVEAGNVDSIAWAGVGGDFVYQGHIGAGNDFYRLVGALGALQHYLLTLFHTENLMDE